ncbi:MAG: Hsp33 family molecular chaperone HslO [Veillonella sp.]|uniref:Hsp33 family molecular chaperone HslO n=1 Tax=Veillonella sp. TaxID=1926307 RepID=UPI0025F512D6|nr:Hsp33 family molecular chaperone HslO [Veillonella sp.]MBE6080745.1 Hsp33 family molecular chaperone HslO [Veillonella sp.]
MDFIRRYTTKEGVRMAFAVTTDTVEEARVRHDLSPVATAALGRAMTGALLMAGDFKNEENVSLRLNGKGPLGVVHVDAFSNNTVRGYVDNPHVDIPLKYAGKMDVGAAVGHDGEVQVTRFTKLRQDYTSQSPMQTGEVAEDLAYYLYTSEQIPATISLGVLVNTDRTTMAAGGFLVQALPDATDEALAQVEANINELGPISHYLEAHPNGEGLVEKVLAGLTSEQVYEGDVAFQCTCSRERFEQILATLQPADKEELLEDETTELVCHYCNEKYQFSRDELKQIFAEASRNDGVAH